MLGIRPDELIRRDKKRQWLVSGAALMTVFSVLIAFILLLLQWNADVAHQLEITERNESEVLALLSEESMESGDRYGAVEYALNGLPNANRDRAYAKQTIHALSQALYLYQDPHYGFGSMVRHGVRIQSFTVSESGTYFPAC